MPVLGTSMKADDITGKGCGACPIDNGAISKAESPECINKDTDPTGLKYAGTTAKTQRGAACRPWTETTAVQTESLKNKNLQPYGSAEGSSCRNRDDGSKTASPWCYTTDTNAQASQIEASKTGGVQFYWDLCYIPNCGPKCAECEGDNCNKKAKDPAPSDKKIDCFTWEVDPKSYGKYFKRSDKSKTCTGAEKCNMPVMGTALVAGDITAKGCGACPTGANIEAKTPECINKKDDPSGFKYAGTVAKTLSGSACLPWTDTEAVQKAFLPDGMKPWGATEGNKCRNRDDGYKTAGPWCYTKDSTAKKSDIEASKTGGVQFYWDLCPVPMCGKKCAECAEADCNSGAGQITAGLALVAAALYMLM